MPRYGLATIFEDHPVGHEFSADDLPLYLTHVDSIALLDKGGATFRNPQFNGDNFTPHISVYGRKRVTAANT